ncbi:FeoA domain protein [Leptospira interrogans str. 2003000735]|uniref:Ferrous iron transport protein A n=6 Tax=Leptospira interrogans TaxID=173 RepID=A0AAP9WA04_LEPIR|nr:MULTISPECIES: FeoA family protein [Leptospira]EMG08293.1 FeoA domain protein [Leptospira interrogans serovar Grippotyphosa str. LT2186]EMN30680.1 FeoA domain protein [Leptospira interrogans serovar Pyrogenes str. L0374]EMP05883.1 FeoA domain protein [Leptospira interrogans serovar Pyrogenes str. 200701872]EMY05593.1 FeoA domain protein [Leptospira interrogans str. 2002000626]EMY24408.1 FeoA domain protein [Leptospira interrogans serovar Australis str. 200703203]
MMLNELEKGQEAPIISLLSKPGKEELFRNILDIGLLPGTSVLVLEKYSSQNKMVIRAGEVEIAIRKVEAELIQVGEIRGSF